MFWAFQTWFLSPLMHCQRTMRVLSRTAPVYRSAQSSGNDEMISMPFFFSIIHTNIHFVRFSPPVDRRKRGLLTGSRGGVEHNLAVGVVDPLLRGPAVGARGHGQGAAVAAARAGVEAEGRVGDLDLGGAVLEVPLLLRGVGAGFAGGRVFWRQ